MLYSTLLPLLLTGRYHARHSQNRGFLIYRICRRKPFQTVLKLSSLFAAGILVKSYSAFSLYLSGKSMSKSYHTFLLDFLRESCQIVYRTFLLYMSQEFLSNSSVPFFFICRENRSQIVLNLFALFFAGIIVKLYRTSLL